MTEPNLLSRIRVELKRTIRLLQEQLQREHPQDHVYTILFEVSVCGKYAIRVAGSEESLMRLAEKYSAKGYHVAQGELIPSLKTFLRWDAPGDDLAGWYWGEQADDALVTKLIEEAMQAGLAEEYGDDQTLRRLCLESLQELDQEEVFGKGVDREQILIGICCCETGFDESSVDELATLNPPKTIERVRREIRNAAKIKLIRPNRSK